MNDRKNNKLKKIVKIERLSGCKMRFLVIGNNENNNEVIKVTLDDLKRLVDEYAHPVVR
jgi:calcineurin-like phosphoesterase family protein